MHIGKLISHYLVTNNEETICFIGTVILYVENEADAIGNFGINISVSDPI